jgi:pseudouridylate synthase
MHDYLSIQPEVSRALQRRQAVVALESTIISHGMPYPRNIETARAVEAAVREAGAVPATIAVLDGRIRIGLDEDDLAMLATDKSIMKLSRRDLPVALATGRHGATTVAATMICAKLAGISVFATGGIGGVHRGAESSYDVSADLDELAHTSVAVVCAGAKSILDLPKTLEVLETRGVPVIGYGTDQFPAFHARSSGLPLQVRCDSAAQVASIMNIKWQLGLNGGVIIANPVPESAALDDALVEQAVTAALAAAAAQNVSGKDVTPFLLAKLAEITEGRSLDANIALVLNNARVAAEIALAYVEAAREPAMPPKPSARMLAP